MYRERGGGKTRREDTMSKETIRRERLWTEDIMKQLREKMSWVCQKNKGKIPYTTDESGNYDDRADISREWPMDDGINWWTNGFWGGLMWLMYLETGEKEYREAAEISEKQLDRCFEMYYGIHHDVGFMYMPTAVMDYRITGSEEGRKRGMHAANILAGRFNPAGNFIRAWNENYGGDPTGRAIIDCMMNLSLLYWASEESKDPRFRHIAEAHAHTVMKYFVRQDGSVCHIVDFDPETGAYAGDVGGQGYGKGSSWTRGQAWAVYGFAVSYRHTGKKEYLHTAEKTADYCIASLPGSGIVPVDFRQPESPAWEDSCAAVILASGLLELSRYSDAPEAYLRTAEKLLLTIARERADFGPGCDAVVQNCSASYHEERHHFPMIYADYFFTEALMKLKGAELPVW